MRACWWNRRRLKPHPVGLNVPLLISAPTVPGKRGRGLGDRQYAIASIRKPPTGLGGGRRMLAIVYYRYPGPRRRFPGTVAAEMRSGKPRPQ
jgi:hypothetical protein